MSRRVTPNFPDIPNCMMYDLDADPVEIPQPESKYLYAREYVCGRCLKSFSERYPTIRVPSDGKCPFDG